MKNCLLLCLTLTLIACGPQQEEIKRAEMEQQRIEQEAAEQLAAVNSTRVAAVTCAVMSETRNMDAAIRVREINAAREKIGGEPFLRGDDAIKEAIEYGLCEELVLDGVIYDEIVDSKPRVKEEFYPSGELEERTNYQSKDDGGKKHGLFRAWYQNGVLRHEWTYKDGKKHGLSRDWYSDGQLMMEYTYKDGKVHGLWRIWDNDGQLKIEGCTSNGEDVDMSNCQG